jgi:hypothetical protein
MRDFEVNPEDVFDDSGNLISTENDLCLCGFGLDLVEDIEQIRQKIKIRLQFFLGEWYLDTTLGVPYFTEVSEKNPKMARIQAIFKAVIIETPGVTELTAFSATYDAALRVFNLDFTVNTIYGSLTMQESV